MRLASLTVSFVFVCFVSHSANSPPAVQAGVPSVDTNLFAGTNFSVHPPKFHPANNYLRPNKQQNDRTKYSIQSLKPNPAVNYCLQITKPNPGTNYLMETIHP
jgi:hypothetical protein